MTAIIESPLIGNVTKIGTGTSTSEQVRARFYKGIGAKATKITLARKGKIILDVVGNKLPTVFSSSLLLGHGPHFLSGFKCFPSLRKGLGCFPQPCDYIISWWVSNKFTTMGIG